MLTHLTVRDFRNLEPFCLEPEAGSHLLLGGNGAGKTSVLEAVYTLATTRSFRAAQIGDCVRHGAGSFHVQGEVDTGQRTTLEVGMMEGQGTPAVNGTRARIAAHVAEIPVIEWT